MSETFTTSDGRTLAYHVTGSGPALIAHGGGPGFSSRYLDDLGGLGAERTLVLLDPRGTGDSHRPADPRAYQIDDYVADVEELRAHLGLERIDLLGHSHGGVVAMRYAALHPDRMSHLVLASTLARFHAEQAQAMEDGMAKRADEPWFDDAQAALQQEQNGEFSDDAELTEIVIRELPFYFARLGDRELRYLDQLKNDSVNADTLGLFNNEIFTEFDLRDDLRTISAPTLVIYGSEDFLTGAACGREIAALIAGAREVVLPDAGHMIFIEQPDAFRRAVVSFLGT